MHINIEAIKDLMFKNGLTSAEVSRKTGISKVHISRILNNSNYKCRATTIKVLADALNVNYKEIVLED